MKTAVSTAMIASAVLCAVLMAFGIASGGMLLQRIHTPREILSDSKLYLDIYIWGLPFLLFYNIATGIFFPPWVIPEPPFSFWQSLPLLTSWRTFSL